MTEFEREHMGFILWKWKVENEADYDPRTWPAVTFEDWQDLTIEEERERYRVMAEDLSNRLLNNLAIIGVGLERCAHCAWDRKMPA